MEIRVVGASPAQKSTIDEVRRAESNRYPDQEEVFLSVGRLALTLAAPGAAQVSSLPTVLHGVRMKSADKCDVATMTADSLRVSRLEPYASWEPLAAELRRLWPIYCAAFGVAQATRLGVRYINRIEFGAADPVDFDAIFTAGPKIPSNLPQGLSEFVTRVVIPFDEQGATLAIVQRLEPSSDHALLDIDAFCARHFEPDSAQIWDQLEALRPIKNDAFFESLHRPVWERYL